MSKAAILPTNQQCTSLKSGLFVSISDVLCSSVKLQISEMEARKRSIQECITDWCRHSEGEDSSDEEVEDEEEEDDSSEDRGFDESEDKMEEEDNDTSNDSMSDDESEDECVPDHIEEDDEDDVSIV
jgi:hypothetical protein